MIHSSHIRRGRSPPPSMYSSYVTRTGLHKILPFHRILFGRISYCSALYFDTATPGPSGRTLNTECRVYIYIYIFGQTKWNSILRGGGGLEERSYRAIRTIESRLRGTPLRGSLFYLFDPCDTLPPPTGLDLAPSPFVREKTISTVARKMLEFSFGIEV